MTDRSRLAQDFLAKTEWLQANSVLLAGDASNRKYFRLSLPGNGTAVLMDAPPEKGEDVRPFIRIARYLAHAGLSAPTLWPRMK